MLLKDDAPLNISISLEQKPTSSQTENEEKD